MAKTFSNLTAALLEMAEDLHGAGLLSNGTFEKITLRHLGPETPPTTVPFGAEEFSSVQDRANLS